MHIMHVYAVLPVNYELLVHNNIHSNQREDPSHPVLLEVDRKMSLLYYMTLLLPIFLLRCSLI